MHPQTTKSSVPYLTDILSTESHLFIALTETWLQDNHKEAELEINGYKLYRKDRDRVKAKYGRSSGGVAIYIRKDIASSFNVLLEFSNGVNEALMLYSENMNLIVCVLYRQPTNERYKSDADDFNEMISCIENKIHSIEGCTPELYVCGDFNIPYTISHNSYKPSKNCNNKLLEILNDFSTTFNLNQIIQKPTHSSGNILDFLLTNNDENIFNYECIPTIYSDHFNVNIITHTNFIMNKEHINETKNLNSDFDKFNFYSEKIDWNNINKDLGKIDWINALENLKSNCEHQYKFILDECAAVVEKHIPTKEPIKKSHTIPRERRILMRKRRKLIKRLTKTFINTQQNKIKEKLINIELELLNSHKKERESNELKATSKIKSNPKYFYSYIKHFSKTKPKVGPLKNPLNKHLITDSREMANILQEQYKSVFSTPKEDYSFLDNENVLPDTIINDIQFSENDFIEEIDTLSTNSAAGPDGIPAIFLKHCKVSIAKPLNIFWRNCLDNNTTPAILKTNFITPIFKSGNQGSPENYRPVALTSQITKVFEKVIRKKLVTFLEENNLFNSSQHGFRPGRSCLSQLLAHT